MLHLTSSRLDAALGAATASRLVRLLVRARVAAWLSALEERYRFVVFEADPAGARASAAFAAQAQQEKAVARPRAAADASAPSPAPPADATGAPSGSGGGVLAPLLV